MNAWQNIQMQISIMDTIHDFLGQDRCEMDAFSVDTTRPANLSSSIQEAKATFRGSQGRSFGAPVSVTLTAKKDHVTLKMSPNDISDDLDILIAIQNLIIEMKRSGDAQRKMFKRYQNEFVKPMSDRLWGENTDNASTPACTTVEEKAQLVLGAEIARHYGRTDPSIIEGKKHAIQKIQIPGQWALRETLLESCKTSKQTHFDLDVTELTRLEDKVTLWAQFCKRVFDANQIWFILDSNRMDNTLFCCNQENVLKYEGIFKEFDAATPNVSYEAKGGAPKREKIYDSDNAPSGKQKCNYDELDHYRASSFTHYALTRESGQMFGFQILQVYQSGLKFVLKHDKEVSIIHLNQPDDLRGVNLFHRAMMQLYKYNNQLGQEHQDAFQNVVHYDLVQGAFKSLANYYGIHPKRLDDGNIDQYQYFLELTDCKRAGDFLQVQAAFENNRAKSSKRERYVFVSADRMAILQARYLGVPCIWTTFKPSPKATIARFYFGSDAGENVKEHVQLGGSPSRRQRAHDRILKQTMPISLLVGRWNVGDPFRTFLERLISFRVSISLFDYVVLRAAFYVDSPVALARLLPMKKPVSTQRYMSMRKYPQAASMFVNK